MKILYVLARAGAIGAILLLLLAAWLLLWPLADDDLVSHPDPATSYAAAIARVQVLQAQETETINPVCRTRLLTHGRPVERTVVLLHGFTNCPQQFEQLGQALFAAGDNVLIPRLPHHGLADRMTPDLAQLTAEELTALAGEVIDAAAGLGDQVIVVGFSAGGVLAGWAAQQRADIDYTILLAPGFGLQAIPDALRAPASRLLIRLPNFYQWWDAETREAIPGPQHAYPRLSSRALAQILRLGLFVQREAARHPLRSPSILVVTNANDESVDNSAAMQVVAGWQAHGASVQTYEFERSAGFVHDLIDPDQPDQHIDQVYPILLDLID